MSVFREAPNAPRHARSEEAVAGARAYPTMDTDDIKAMPVRGIAADDAVLWLCATNAHLRVAFDVVEAWGFEYRALLTWVKDHMGTGEWLRGQTEHCLLAVRGRPVFVRGTHTTVLQTARREHSRKPEVFYDLVEETCAGGKLELFCRQRRDGWQVYGNDTVKFWKAGTGTRNANADNTILHAS